MSYLAIYNATNDPNFQGRCQVAMWRAAQDIAAEDPATPAHVVRKDWAERVLGDRAEIKPRQLAMQVLRNDSIAANPDTATDGDIQFQVNSIIDSLIMIG